MTVPHTLNQTDEQEIKAWVGQILRPNVANYSGLERFEVDGQTITCHPYFGPWEAEPSAQRLAELVAMFEAEHPGCTLNLT
jgi:hypothetical protein